jgi:hypothetical protein
MIMRLALSHPVQSLVWDGDDLVDIVGGWRRWRADGSEEHRRVNYAFPFDRALMSPSGRFQLLYAERGTKGLVLEVGKVRREINRSFYHANAYDYPAALGRLPDGREILVHCPDAYNVLEIEELGTGRRLTTGARHAVDVFHSRLTVSPDGRWLLSAGWLWHPVGTVGVYDLVAAVEDPIVLDRHSVLWDHVGAGVEAACWLDADRLLVSGHPDEEPVDSEDLSLLAPGELGVWSLSQQAWSHRRRIDFRVGTLLGCQGRALGVYGHPRLIDPATATVLAQWPEVATSSKDASYSPQPTPIVAVHPDDPGRGCHYRRHRRDRPPKFDGSPIAPAADGPHAGALPLHVFPLGGVWQRPGDEEPSERLPGGRYGHGLPAREPVLGRSSADGPHQSTPQRAQRASGSLQFASPTSVRGAQQSKQPWPSDRTSGDQ